MFYFNKKPVFIINQFDYYQLFPVELVFFIATHLACYFFNSQKQHLSETIMKDKLSVKLELTFHFALGEPEYSYQLFYQLH